MGFYESVCGCLRSSANVTVIVGTRTKDIADAVREVLAHGWVEVPGKRYRKFRCPCGAHTKTIKKTPSDPNYVKNLMGWFRRQDCWKDG